jgi:hypothetical protein
MLKKSFRRVLRRLLLSDAWARLVPMAGFGNRFDDTNGCSHGGLRSLNAREGVAVVQLATGCPASFAQGMKARKQLQPALASWARLEFVAQVDWSAIVHGD